VRGSRSVIIGYDDGIRFRVGLEELKREREVLLYLPADAFLERFWTGSIGRRVGRLRRRGEDREEAMGR
jgi:hypothetical protein